MPSLRITTLNVWNKSGPWAKRLPVLRAELERVAPDVIGLQEVLRLHADGESPDGAFDVPLRAEEAPGDQTVEIGAGLGFRAMAYAQASDYGGGLAFGNAVLSRHPIIEHRVLELPGVESGERRSALYALVATPHGDLRFFVTHLNWKLHHGSVRIRQVQALVDWIFELAPVSDARLPPVVVGDFNADPDTDEIRFLKGKATLHERSVYFADSWDYGGSGPGFTFDRRNRFAAIALEPPRRIDYVFVRGPDRKRRGEPVKSELSFATPASDAEGEIWPSDHFGVSVEVRV